VVGKTGTGFSHDILKDMLKNPDAYIGRTAKVEAQEQFPSGALRAPSFHSMHQDIQKEGMAKALPKWIYALASKKGMSVAELFKNFTINQVARQRAVARQGQLNLAPKQLLPAWFYNKKNPQFDKKNMLERLEQSWAEAKKGETMGLPGFSAAEKTSIMPLTLEERSTRFQELLNKLGNKNGNTNIPK
jgi:hypothetical protein